MSADRELPVLPPRSASAVYIACAAVIIASYLWRCSTLGLGHPMPWPDEGSFLWQALAFQKHNSLLSPQLNPDRPIMWMPPGYMIVQGLIFKLTGFSLQWARGLSALFMAGGCALLAALFWRLRAPFAGLLLCAVFLHSPIAVLVGNVARMESLMFLTAATALLLQVRERWAIGLSLVAVLPLIHPNGLYFWLGGAASLVLYVLRTEGRQRPSRWGFLAMASALVLWLAYGVYAFNHLGALVSDMAFQFNWKDALGSGAEVARRRLLLPSIFVPLAIMLVAAVPAWRRRGPSLLLLCYCAPLFLLSVTSPGWLYDLYLAFAYLLFAAFLLQVVTDGAPQRLVVALVLGVALAGAGFVLSREDGPLLRSVQRSLTAVRAPEVDYFISADEDAIRRALEAAAAKAPVSVVFFPWAEALLFTDLESDRLRLVQLTFHKFHADIQIVHESRYIPSWVRRWFLLRVRQIQGIDRPVADWPIIQERNGSERWRINQRVRGPSPEASP